MPLKSKPDFLIFLIGMPAVGKTYWGDKIAKQYHLSFTDLDAFIEQEEKCTIPGLFAYGETFFREKERTYLKQAIKNMPRPAVIACGGGTPCFNDNLGIMKETGVVIYLRADVPYLLQNIKNSAKTRPLLNKNPDIAAYLAGLLKIRAPIFEQANYVIDIKDISLTTIDKIISLCTKSQ